MNPKHEAAAALLAFHDEFLLHLNPAWPDVIVPAHLQGRRTVALHWGTKLAVPIPDFEITGWGVRGTLVFRGQSVYCQVPWASVWAVQSAADATKATVFHPERGWLADVLKLPIGIVAAFDIDLGNTPTANSIATVRKLGAQPPKTDPLQAIHEWGRLGYVSKSGAEVLRRNAKAAAKRPAWFRGVIKGGKADV